MRQLNNKQFDTKEGASASLSEIVSSQFAPSVSQKDENQMKITEQLAIDVMKKKKIKYLICFLVKSL
jgi:F420-0:gamma-glutamyl ligase